MFYLKDHEAWPPAGKDNREQEERRDQIREIHACVKENKAGKSTRALRREADRSQVSRPGWDEEVPQVDGRE